MDASVERDEAPPEQRRRRRWITAGLVLLALGCFTVSVVLLYPGYINSDSQWQLEQARSGQFNNWHPALLSYLWRYLDKTISGTGGLFLFTELLFWSGLVAFLHHTLGSFRKTAAYAVAFLLHIPLMVSFSQIGKDAALVAVLMFSVGALAQAERRRSWPALIAAGVALVLAFGFRHNALFAILPLLLWAAVILRDGLLPPRLGRALAARGRVLMAAGALLAGVIAVHTAVVVWLIKPTPSYEGQVIYTFDLAGISVLSGESYFPRFMDRGPTPLTVSDLEKIYLPRDVTPLLWVPPGKRGPGFVWTQQEYNTLRGHWVGAIVSQPGAYLTHRARSFLALLNVGLGESHWPYWLPDSEAVARGPGGNARLTAWLYHIVEDARTSFPFKAWPYALASLVLVAIALLPGAPAPRAFWALAASVLAYEAGYFLVAPADNFRFSWWVVAGAPLLPAAMPLKARSRWLRDKAGHLRRLRLPLPHRRAGLRTPT